AGPLLGAPRDGQGPVDSRPDRAPEWYERESAGADVRRHALEADARPGRPAGMGPRLRQGLRARPPDGRIASEPSAGSPPGGGPSRRVRGRRGAAEKAGP